MWKQFAKDYLCFSKGERRAVLVLLALTLLVFVLPWCWPAGKAVAPDKRVLEELERQMGQLKQPGPGTKQREAYSSGPSAWSSAKAVNASRPKGRLFYFDPNTLPETGLKALGLRDKTIQTIQHYREKGGRFRRPEDLGRVYGLYPDEYTRLLPYIKMEQPATAAKQAYSAPPGDASRRRTGYTAWPAKTTALHSIDINTADTLAFITLPGIGSRLAARIVHFREKLGGFYSVEQVGETYALPDSVFERIKALLRCDSNAIQRININTADAARLQQHPYMRWNIANAIVEYRRQHGEYKSVDELQRIALITPDVFAKLRPYVYVP